MGNMLSLKRLQMNDLLISNHSLVLIVLSTYFQLEHVQMEVPNRPRQIASARCIHKVVQCAEAYFLREMIAVLCMADLVAPECNQIPQTGLLLSRRLIISRTSATTCQHLNLFTL